MTTLFFIIGFLLLMILIAAVSNSSTPATACVQERSDLKKIDSIIMENESNSNLFKTLKTIFKSGNTYEEYAQENGYEDSIALNKKFQNQIDVIVNKNDKDILSSLNDALFDRGLFITSGKGLIMHPQENCFFRCTNTIVYTITKLMKNISYTGFRYNKELFRTGNLYVTSKDITGWKEYSRGTMYITNQRIVIIGLDNKTKSIPLSQIISYSNYENNGILFQIANSNPFIFTLPCDGMFHFNTVIGTTFEDDIYPCLLALDKVFEENNNK